jgi:hypothetical protein
MAQMLKEEGLEEVNFTPRREKTSGVESIGVLIVIYVGDKVADAVIGESVESLTKKAVSRFKERHKDAKVDVEIDEVDDERTESMTESFTETDLPEALQPWTRIVDVTDAGVEHQIGLWGSPLWLSPDDAVHAGGKSWRVLRSRLELPAIGPDGPRRAALHIEVVSIED